MGRCKFKKFAEGQTRQHMGGRAGQTFATQSRPQPHPAMANPATIRRKTQTGRYYPKLKAACPPLGMSLPRKSKQTKAVTLVIL
eukprot:g74166.t1